MPASLSSPGRVGCRLLDLADFHAVRAGFKEDRPHLIIHCAALSRSPASQENPALALRLNVEVTAGLTPGQRYVTSGAFTLKAQLSKSAFGEGHSH